MTRRARRQLVVGAVVFGCSACGGARPQEKCPPSVVAGPPEQAAPPSSAPATPQADPVIPVGDLLFSVHARPLANLAYQLDCMAGLPDVTCARYAIEPLWKPSWSKEDDDALAAWRQVRKRYSMELDVEPDGPIEHPLIPEVPAGLSFGNRVRVASLSARSADEYRANLELLIEPPDAASLLGAIEHFRPRFDAWWAKQGGAAGEHLRDGMGQLLQRRDVAEVLDRVERFYGAPLPKGTTIDFDLVVLPTDAKEGVTNGKSVGTHGVVEVFAADRAEDHLSVICHELFHFFSGSRTPSQVASLETRFAASGDAEAAVAYGLLEESLATAFGNGVIARLTNRDDYAKRRSRAQGLYNDASIDATTKAFLTATNDDPSLGPPLDSSETVATFLRAFHEAMTPAPPPREYLRAYELIDDGRSWSPAFELPDVRTSSRWGSAPLDDPNTTAQFARYALLPTVVLVPRKRLPALAAYGGALSTDVRKELGREAKRPGAFAYVWRRPSGGMVFFVVADDPKAAHEVADALFHGPALTLGVFRPAGADSGGS
jgi:hypothetical protein